jgi:site-specific recombinase XerD
LRLLALGIDPAESEETIMVMRLAVQVTGPLAEFEDGFCARLGELGYKPSSAEGQMRLMADLSGWLSNEGLAVVELTDEVVGSFVVARRASGRRLHRSPLALAPLLGHLRELGAIPTATTRPASTATEKLLEEYHCYLVNERGLVPGTVRNQVAVARLFLSGLPSREDLDLANLTASEVNSFMLGLARSHERAPRSAMNLVAAATGLRSLFRFLFFEGRTPISLVDAVPTAPQWKRTSLPRALDASHVSAMLDGCDRTRGVGLRDFAILTMLVRLGLRSAEVAGLRLDDVDWRAGDLVVRGKANREARLPVPWDVGEALADYLRDARPPSMSRNVFLRALAPHVEMTPGAVGMVVALACDRAGLARVGAHRLRHTAATEMLRHGASLTEIGDVLRHRRPETTAIYAKVDRVALGELARPWPVTGVRP